MDLVPFVAAAAGSLRVVRSGGHRWQVRQAERLGRMLDHARAGTPLGGERIPEGPREAPHARLAEVGPIDKPTLMARFSDAVVGGLPFEEVEAFIREPKQTFLRGRYVVAHTSGTTGRVGCFVFGRRTWAAMNGALVARILRHRLVPREVARFSFGRRYRMAMVAATGGPYATHLVAERRPGGAGLLADVRSFSVLAPAPELRAALEAFGPHYLHGYPSSVAALAHARADGRLAIDPEFISLGSEPLGAATRARIETAFPRAEVVETYGATEHLAIANQCRAGALHLNADLVVLEPRDAAGRPVPPGTPSDHVLLTNLVETAMPIVRYRLDDVVTVLDDRAPCPCGVSLPRIRVDGRRDDTLWLVDQAGRAHAFPPVPFEVLCLETAGVERYRLSHVAQNQIELCFIAASGADRGTVAAELERRLTRFFDASPVAGRVAVSARPVAALPRGPAGKHRQIESRVPPPPC